MELIDTHCHLDVSPLVEDLAGVLSRARAAGVTSIVAPAYDLASWPRVAALRAHAGVSPAIGLHPWVAEQPLERSALSAALRDAAAVAVGEIGLDAKVPSPTLEVQQATLRLQLEVAVTLDLPVLLHCRGAHEQLLAALRPFAGRLRGVAHAFSRGPELAARFVDLGLYVAFGGAVTRQNANRVRRAATTVPLDRVLLETDAPSIGLEGVPAEAAEPCHTRQVAEAVAAARGVSVEQVAEVTTRNARELLRLP